MNPKTALLEKIENKTARIGIIGMGYVGLPLALRFLEAGYHVLGLDIDRRKCDLLMAGQSYIGHIGAAPIAEAVRIQYGGSMKPDNAAELLSQPDVDGGLIGGASLSGEDFTAIVTAGV